VPQKTIKMAYDNNYIAAILLKHEHGACTADELKILELWYSNLDDKAALDKFNYSNKAIKKASAWVNITQEIGLKETEDIKVVQLKPSKSVFYYIARIAAVIVVVAGSYAAFNFFNAKNAEAVQYISQINNTDKPIKIILPDNSLLWLQSKSSVKYPAHFSATRNISLLGGKVFFNIAHDSSRPFIVETGNGVKTTVLGTAFVIEKQDENNSVKVSVLRGKVQVSDDVKKYATLTKNQGVDVNVKSKNADLVIADSLLMTNWFVSEVVLDNITLKEVAASIKENFGYKIEFASPGLLLKSFSITYSTTDNVDDILTPIDKVYHTTHSIKDSIIYIKSIQP
jgi:transmembrane sensor